MSKKIDANLLKQIQDMEAAKREEAMAYIVPPATISFDEWWVGASKAKSLKSWMKEIVWADFKARKLKKEEAPATYDEGLRLFGY